MQEKKLNYIFNKLLFLINAYIFSSPSPKPLFLKARVSACEKRKTIVLWLYSKYLLIKNVNYLETYTATYHKK